MPALTASASPAKTEHRRTRSTTILKSIVSSKTHKRAPSNGTSLQVAGPKSNALGPLLPGQAPLLPPDHPHSIGRILNEIQNPSATANPPSPRKGRDAKEGKEIDKPSKDGLDGADKREFQKQAKKEKSTNNLAAVFGRGKSSMRGNDAYSSPKDKENQTPPSSAGAALETPIWSQFSSQNLQEITTTTSIPLNDRKSIEVEIAKYTPSNYSPSKQRNFYDMAQPTLCNRLPQDSRPKSMALPSSSSSYSLLENIQRKMSGERERPKVSNPSKSTQGANSKKNTFAAAKEGRVRAAVAAFNVKTKDKEITEPMDPVQLVKDFEAVLDSRNIPEEMRPTMRTLADIVKIDFIQKNKIEQQSSPQLSATSRFSNLAETLSKRPNIGRATSNPQETDTKPKTESDGSNGKKSRPRSRTFTFSKGDSPTKKTKGDSNAVKKGDVSKSLPKSPSMRSLSSVSSAPAAPSAVPDEFVNYLRKTQKPQDVEVGKLHKLRLLLRNETVAWVDDFITKGGMTEVVGLIRRILEIEWREEHEDSLLHQTLLCLKGLCTTDLARRRLQEIEDMVFPPLVAMLFDEEHKGPSEFTTREIIIRTLFTHLCAARGSDLPGRARTILGYLRDRAPPESSQPLPFIQEMHRPRPYRVWCREINNVSKEVFWIFLHHLNVIPLPTSATSLETSIKAEGSSSSASSRPSSRPSTSAGKKDPFSVAYFPQPRPPVPAAPYIGGVEWDATQYLATHMDLLNGLIASLSTPDERNALRAELRASGFEKVLGGALRTCKEKFYGHIHDVLKEWVAAANADGWDTKPVRMGESGQSPTKSLHGSSPVKKKKKDDKPPPRMELPALDLGFEKPAEHKNSVGVIDDWLGV